MAPAPANIVPNAMIMAFFYNFIFVLLYSLESFQMKRRLAEHYFGLIR